LAIVDGTEFGGGGVEFQTPVRRPVMAFCDNFDAAHDQSSLDFINSRGWRDLECSWSEAIQVAEYSLMRWDQKAKSSVKQTDRETDEAEMRKNVTHSISQHGRKTRG
jgi:hypothetical protein